jgi:hypothetical protein
VHSYLVAPPAAAELLLDVERRLRDKLGAASRTIGRTIEVVPRLASCPEPSLVQAGTATRRGETAEHAARWARVAHGRSSHRTPRALVAAVACGETGWLAALDDGRLVAALNGEPPNADDAVDRAVRLCDGPPRPLAPGEAAERVAECERWIGAEMLARECGHTSVSRVLDVKLDRRVARTIERAPRHLQASVAALAAPLLATVRMPRPLGAERALQRVLDEPANGVDPAWLTRAADLAETCTDRLRTRDRAPRLVALIAVGP